LQGIDTQAFGRHIGDEVRERSFAELSKATQLQWLAAFDIVAELREHIRLTRYVLTRGS